MRVIIWYKDLEAGMEQMERIIYNYHFHNNIKVLRKLNTKYEKIIELENGDLISAIPAIERFKGMRCDISYVERAVDKEYFDNIIRHCTTGLPVHGFCLFGEGYLVID